MKDLDFERLQVTVRDGKGEKDRVTLLPEAVVEPLKQHLAHVRQAHERALREGYGYAVKSPADRFWAAALQRREGGAGGTTALNKWALPQDRREEVAFPLWAARG